MMAQRIEPCFRTRFSGAAAVGVVVFTTLRAAAAAVGAFEPLEIDTASGKHLYKVEVMKTEAEREHGLMNRKSVAQDQGMLFDFVRDQQVAFWMKNTLIPLDMIFIDHTGRVVAIKHDAKPMDETPIPSNAPTTGVLELNAGAADAIGLKVGDHVRHPIFGAASP